MASTRISGIRKNKDGTFTESASRASSDSYKPNTADANASATNPTATGYNPSAAVNSAKQAYTATWTAYPATVTAASIATASTVERAFFNILFLL